MRREDEIGNRNKREVKGEREEKMRREDETGNRNKREVKGEREEKMRIEDEMRQEIGIRER
jgi:hypothetical protein